MAAQMVRYIRADTTCTKTRYIVNTYKPRKLEERASKLCKQVTKHLGLQKGVIYSCSRVQYKQLAKELGCAYYHARVVDNKERLNAQLECGRMMVATLALRIGVDFLGIVFILHIDILYSMIDFLQESGRAGCVGEDIDLVILVEEGKVERLLASRQARGLDKSVIYDFITTGCCQRRVIGLYLNSKETEYRSNASLIRCNRCSKGIIALEREYSQVAREYQIVEETLNKLRDRCASCFVTSINDSSVDQYHSLAECSRVGLKIQRELDQKFQKLIRFEEHSHTYFKYSFSQKLYNIGVDRSNACQQPNIVALLLRTIILTSHSRMVAKHTGLNKEKVQLGEVVGWLGAKYRVQVWGKLMSNASALTINFIMQKAKLEAHTRIESLDRVLVDKENEPLDTLIGAEQEPAIKSKYHHIEQELAIESKHHIISRRKGCRQSKGPTRY